ncbi:kinase-like protein [Lophiostoma macrostomum CBS 122681]|uniref:Kinase-like protein n=1 Tax=Lophiostoma macrostomum CBS 122681 TaxID=1314788 RepID=A0A6A6TG89_9PLEO|nr:kinase-like protein [Lophiostoma macrostomum CBS 122681]
MYIKRPNYLRSARWLGCLSGIVDGNTIAKLSMREIRVCELLKDNPHPNVAVYYGVCTDTARVVGLCFKKYDGTLQDVVDRDQTFDAEKAMADIEIGVAHLHKLGLVHCDLKPANIFHENGSFVIGDFDSCHKIGDPYRLKAGSRGWCPIHIHAIDLSRPDVRLAGWQAASNNLHKVIIEQGQLQFFAITDAPLNSLHLTDPSKWHTPPRRIDIDRIYPPLAPGMTIYGEEPIELSIDIYIKRLDLLGLSKEHFDDDIVLRTTRREIATCELLHANPHPSICDYRGVVMHRDRMLITGLCFERFALNLDELVRSQRWFNAGACMQQIEAGLDHLHGLGLVHCDIKPQNIFVSFDLQRFVVGDFDSCHVRGQRLVDKVGTEGWTLDRFVYAHREVDFYGLSLIRYWLECKGWGAPMAGEEYMSTDEILDGNAGSMLDEEEEEKEEERQMDVVEVQRQPESQIAFGLGAVEEFNRKAECLDDGDPNETW